MPDTPRNTILFTAFLKILQQINRRSDPATPPRRLNTFEVQPQPEYEVVLWSLNTQFMCLPVRTLGYGEMDVVMFLSRRMLLSISIRIIHGFRRRRRRCSTPGQTEPDPDTNPESGWLQSLMSFQTRCTALSTPYL
jgi:hypothetical protein